MRQLCPSAGSLRASKSELNVIFVPGAASQELGPAVGLRLALEARHRQEHRTHLALPEGAALRRGHGSPRAAGGTAAGAAGQAGRPGWAARVATADVAAHVAAAGQAEAGSVGRADVELEGRAADSVALAQVRAAAAAPAPAGTSGSITLLARLCRAACGGDSSGGCRWQDGFAWPCCWL